MAKILIIDDSPAMRTMVAHTLKSGGHQVTAAVDGLDGIDKTKAEAFDVVFTDINMPKMDGLEVVAKLRGTPGYKTTPIIVLTTESDANLKQQGKKAGATGWIIKPFEPEILLKTVARVSD